MKKKHLILIHIDDFNKQTIRNIQTNNKKNKNLSMLMIQFVT